MKRLVLAVLVAAALLPSPTPAAGGGGAIAVELSRLVLPEASWKKMMKDVSEQTRQFVEQSAQQSGTTLPAGFGAKFSEEFGKLFTYQEMIDLNAGLLAKHYTEAELKELAAFYRTPLGQKAIRIMPEVSADVNGQMMVLMQQRMPGMMERLKTALDGPQAAPAKAPAAKPAK